MITGPYPGSIARPRRTPFTVSCVFCAKTSRSPLPQKRVPRRLLSSREAGPVLEQEVRAAERARREDEAIRGQHVLGRRRPSRLALDGSRVVDVADHVPAFRPGRERLHLAADADVGSVPELREREVVEVERVLRAVVAAEVALAAHPAGLAHAAVEVRLLAADRLAEYGRRARFRRERDRELGEDPLEPEALQRPRAARPSSACGRTGRAPSGTARRGASPRAARSGARGRRSATGQLSQPPAFEVLLHEGRAVLAQQDVRVEERSAAEPARDDPAEPAELPGVEDSVQALARVPEAAGDRQRAARERAGRIRLAALEDADAHPRLRQPERRH